MLLNLSFAQDLSDFIICIDPGHGGHESDDRYMSWAEFWESESNLSKAFFLDTLLRNLGATVVLTRHFNGDEGIDNDPGLSERAAIANNAGADFFHSIHSNGGSGNANYTLILYPGPTGDPRINGLSGYPPCPIELTISNQMATQIYSTNRTTYKTTAGDWTFYGTGQPYLGVFRTLRLPGSLSEGSFHDYYPETFRLKSRAYHKNEAWAIARTYALILDTADFATFNLAGIVRDPDEQVTYTYLTTADSYKPVNNITVTLEPGGKTFRGDSWNNGYFLFDNLAAGTYQLKVTAEGYYPDSAQVTVGTTFFNFKDFYLISKKPPRLASSSPANGDTNFVITNKIILNFSRAMDTTKVRQNFQITPEVVGTFSWKNNNKQLQFKPDSLKAKTWYTLRITGAATDKYGHPFDGNGDGVGGDDLTITFKTGPEDITPPKVAFIYPPQVGTNIEPRPIINIVMSELVDTTSIASNTVTLTRYSTNTLVAGTLKHYSISNRTVLAFFPAENLAAGELYVTKLQAGLKDLYGNTTTSTTSYSFRVGNYTYTNQISIDSFESGVIDNWWAPSSSGSTTGIVPAYTSRTTDSVFVNLLTNSKSSLNIKYSWDPSASEWLLREYLAGGSPRNVLFNASYILQVYIFGDGSGNKFRFAVDKNYPSTAVSDHEVSPWYEITWYGWRLVSWDMTNDGCGTWLGNGQLTGTLRFDSFQLTYKEGAPTTGSFYFDDLRVVQKVATFIPSESIPVAQQVQLLPNYPNPFNPRTTIPFVLPAKTLVQLDIYDLLGNHVMNLCNQYFEAGWHQIDIQLEQFASGVYFYTLRTPTTTLTRKMQLLK
jgi:N-acetylmuramoyl-L-alanine amidase